MISTTIPPKVATICTRALLLSFLTFYLPSLTPASAQTAGQISIGGKVYGGGKEGAILTGNTTNPAAADAKDVTLTVTDFTLATAQASQVTINSADDADVQITAVFGGGEQGRAYGKTNVTVNGGTIGVAGMADSNPNKPVNGNAFGAGDGQGADVFGGTHVLITAGTINGSVYGGGNQADLVGSTELTLQGGKYVGAVFGGAKQADIWGHTFVNVDGANAKNDLHIIDVYGGNDIAGNIKPAPAADYPNWTWAQQANLSIPSQLGTSPEEPLANTPHLTNKPKNTVTKEWNAFVYASKGTTYKTLIDNIYGGGNGDYGETDAEGVYTTGAYAGQNLKKPVIDRTYLQIEGGMYGSLYGGGNAATVAVSTDICLVNTTAASASYIESLENPSLSRFSSTYQFNRVFGGNNKEPMAIRPNWYLEKGTINNLYSGGNAGPMTYFHQTSTGGAQSLAGDAGILVHVKSNDMTINNVYGGCRMADVDPNGHQGADMTLNAETIDGYNFPRGYAARVLIEGGNINNVYGGNDVSGNVYYGSLVEIHSSINGNVYGAGNGSYAYTDNVNLKGDKEYGDYYYDGGAGGLASAQALSIHRPNAAQSYVHVTGTESKPTYIGGAIYCGGNSATLRSQSGSLTDVNAELHIGSYVIADNVFLGSNGENMVKSETENDLLQIYKNGPVGYSAYAAANSISGNYSSMDLTVSEQFEEYMRGVEVAIKPTVSFDADYVSHSTKFGSLYCGGNVGSMSADGYFNLDFLKKLVIYNKLVGGCNNANVAKTDYNAFHLGGLTGDPDANNNKVLLTIAGLQLEPRVLTGNVKDGFSLNDWNKAPIVGADPAADMLIGGNIYGGCYSSGYINGGVNIDIQQNAISPNVFAAAPTGSGVTYDEIRDDVLASTLSTYGGGYGKETEIWGNVTVSITGNGQIMKAYGGGEMGVVGKLDRDVDGNYLTVDTLEWYPTTKDSTFCDTTIVVSGYAAKPHKVAQFAENSTYNTTVNLNANLLANDTLNVAKLYAGGFQGTVSGSTTLNLNRGRAYDAFGGASNADILGHAETYIGKASAPTITHNVYGANDFGGLIVGQKLFEVDNTNNEMEKIVAQTYVEYYAGKIGDGTNDGKVGSLEGGNIFGGPCGAYEYTEDRYFEWDLSDPENPVKGAPKYVCKPMLLKDMLTKDMLVQHGGAGYGANSFVNIISPSTSANDYIEGAIFGAGQGKKGRINSADERGSYVRLASATAEQRTAKDLSPRVYGAGYCSNTNRSLVDAYTGRFGTIFGAAHGITYEEVLGLIAHDGTYETNYMGYRSAVRLHQMVNRQMDIYGGGANAGAQESGVVLNGGQAKDVYGASYDQGITYAATVDVPATSTTKVNTIFGGARGKSDEFPCDVFNTFVTWRSANARVNTAIYGGNNNARMTRNAYISINQPVKNYEDKLTDVFGGGYGENTVTLYTEVGLHDSAQVANAYGGGNNGKVLDTPSFRYYLDDGKLPLLDKDAAVSASNPLKPESDGRKIYPTQLLGEGYGYQKYLLDTEVIGFHSWIMANYWTCGRKDSRKQPLGSYEANDHGHAHDLYFLSTQMDNVKNTHVIIEKGATVAENVYGGGYGANATVSGETHVQLLGGTVVGDIYGGGYGGHVEEYPYLIYPSTGNHELTMSATNVDLGAGSARNVYGGGLNGNVTGATYVTLGTKDQGLNNYYGTVTDSARDSDIKYGQLAIFYHDTLFAGDPIVERSLYGGGQNGHVKGTAYLTINQGHVGYKYVAPDADAYAAASESEKAAMRAAAYVENLDLNDPGDNFLDQNGNAFGAGYGEGAYVDVTYVNMYGGTIRNSLYGGGEIAAVGEATMAQTGAHPQVGTISVPGRTHIYMYNGLVQGDVFGGGRGYSYDLTGNEVIGKQFFTDGYVFGTTDVNIRGGIVGTPETVANGQGNVFGGGNIGYVFSDAHKDGVKGDGHGEGRYYTNKWECQQCHHYDYTYNAPTVCGHCGKSVGATDPQFKTTFTQVGSNILSEDSRVVISPYAQVIDPAGIRIVGNDTYLPDGTQLVTKTFAQGEYVPTEYLDLLKDKNTDATQWAKLSNDGVTVRNAVFAGGNVSSGSDKVYANAITVFGNATASVNDIFFRDLITIGTEHTGGLYGDGNLTFVDGYRELNITNYGTDYYSQQDHITLDEYNAMNDRERAYFELEYQTSNEHTDNYYSCNIPGTYNINGVDKAFLRGQHITPEEYNSLPDAQKTTAIWTNGTKTYHEGDKIKQSEWNMLSAAEQEKWEMFGFCSIYAGRLLNTIQRADFCGVFGSRIVLQGAQDRVPEVVDYTQYTINRVGELSLNKKVYEGTDVSGLTEDLKNHGNYFGMYNIVNYLGALTSDVDFHSVRTTDNTDPGYKDPVGDKAYGVATYYDWKVGHENDKKRNNGTSHNTVALAAGVYLELVKEPTSAIVDPDAEKDYGLITGVVQLDLINVMPGLGGGYVYAKNVHGERSDADGATGLHENLSIYNLNAVNNSKYTYSNTPGHIETSGNFIHNVKQIVDDCFPRGGDVSQPAHYWYIRGEIYVYDQYISAFTGSSTAYSENINLPLTITAGANGRLDLIDIKQNMFAYYKEGTTPLGANDAIVVNNITYGLNDVITYWDYMQLSDEQKAHFVKETYVAQKDYCTSDMGTVIEKGEVVLPGDSKLSGTYYDPEDIWKEDVTEIPHMRVIPASDVFHVSNAVNHNNGYVLAIKLDNPGDWDSWYSPESGANKINQATYADKTDGEKTGYLMGPTYYTETSGAYGQHEHVLDEIVTKAVVDAYNQIPAADFTNISGAQAKVQTAYVAIATAEYDYDGQHKKVQEGLGISLDEYESLSAENKAKFAQAYTCTNTFEEDASSGLYIYFGELIPASKYQDFHNKLEQVYAELNSGATAAEKKNYADKEMSDHFDRAYIVTEAGLYGGQHFESGHNYRALDTWATLSAADREKFNFRYDALDALLFSDATSTDPLKYYPATGEEGPGYSTAGGNDVARYDGPYWTGAGTDADPLHQVYGAKQPIDYTARYTGSENLTYTDKGGTPHTIRPDSVLGREDYENLPNEKRHYSSFEVKAEDAGKTFYIVKESFISGGTNYAAGRVITEEVYNTFDSGRQAKVITYTPSAAGTYYICRESYTVNEKGGGQDVKNIVNSTTYSTGATVPSGAIISKAHYDNLVNLQNDVAHGVTFTIIGNSPIETSTFYVNRESDIYDLSKDRIVTLVYQYRYEESDESGQNVEEITERHIINVHITFKSGVPTIGKLQDPSIVLPGQTVGLKQPGVTPGAYEILGGGWELFTNPEDAEKHTNGKTYVNNATPMYWYQDGYYVAYYAKTYLGKTYSNSVPFKVANYHDISEVMADTDNYMFIDNPNVKRNSKIYIDTNINEKYTTKNPDSDKSEIDMLYDLFQTSLATTTKTIHVDVQDQYEVGGVKKYWLVDGEGKPTTTMTDTETAYPVHLYWDVDDAGNKDESKPKVTTITAFPVTHQVERIVPQFDDHARNLANLAFYLSEDVSTTKAGGWEPIGHYDDVPAQNLCFMGRLHGMGYTINGLDNSLFENLCGYVYNLGVTGSFTRSGVADRVSDGTVPGTGEVVHGHVNSSWIYTTKDIATAITEEGLNPHDEAQQYLPVVGVPNDLSQGVAGVHTLNCYFPEECGYPMSIYSRGPNTTANSATLRQFNNGEVAYDLNGFYLNKRYSDNALSDADKTNITGHTTPSTGDAAIYKFWKQQSDGTLEATPTTGYYTDGGSMHAYNGENLGYVERLFADGDFVYQHGTIPLVTNERYSTTESRYLPIWPDDYYFFGQQLTYGYDETERPYQPLPAHARKTVSADGSGKDNRLVTTEKSNIIYRVPAYFRSKEKKWAHFNPYAVFADKMEEGYTLSQFDQDRGLTSAVLDGRDVHPGLTAIDFTGHNDFTFWTTDNLSTRKFLSGMTIDHKLVYSRGSRNISGLSSYTSNIGTYQNLAKLDDGAYFGPITDYTTLMGIQTFGITQNLLAYAPTQAYSAGTANTRTVLDNYFNEPAYAEHYSGDAPDVNGHTYRTVDVLDPSSTISSIKGHLVMKENTTDDHHYYYAAEDHFLVDCQDFNAPFEYEFNTTKGNYRMWYQRTPDNYAGLDNEGKTMGWEGVSLPFSAELVTTQDKGEITHFYNSALNAAYTEGKTSGHEYWLREFTGTTTTTGTAPDPTVTTAVMNYPVEVTGNAKSGINAVKNTFLWDYYYNADGKDANKDDYRPDINNDGVNEQDTTRYYYAVAREYENYPLSVPGKPYIAGFPGGRYYEFDLSGTFVPQHSGTTTPRQLDPQVITFVSNTGITIKVSDDECAAGKSSSGGYDFVPSYLNITAPVSAGDNNYYVLNAEGSRYEKTETEAKQVAAFRPHFKATASAALHAPSIAFTSVTLDKGKAEPEVEENRSGNLRIWAADGNIYVVSESDEVEHVRVSYVTGVSVASGLIQPGEMLVFPIAQRGIYLVNTTKVLISL